MHESSDSELVVRGCCGVTVQREYRIQDTEVGYNMMPDIWRYIGYMEGHVVQHTWISWERVTMTDRN
jgi:hypothetical protein